MPDLGLTHVALAVTDSAASAEFYRRFANLEVVHRRPNDPPPGEVLWLADGTRPFVVVLVPVDAVPHPLRALSHLGVACPDRATVDRLVAEAGADGHRVLGPADSGPPVGYWAIVEDPDGHALELSFGQETALAAIGAR